MIEFIQRANGKYIALTPGGTPLHSGQDALDIIGACFENDTFLVLLVDGSLSDDFFRLRTGLAGAVLQKFSNYGVKAALVLDGKKRVQGKFNDLLNELRSGRDIRAFEGEAEAEAWLLAQ
jgi:PadR family transcriptional regulator, regulatory protein AphA